MTPEAIRWSNRLLRPATPYRLRFTDATSPHYNGPVMRPLVVALQLALLAAPPAKRMNDGNRWTTRNLATTSVPSFCYGNNEQNCRHYGRLYTWAAAQQACQSLGPAWRLPTDQDWRNLARQHGGVSEDSPDRGKAAYKALLAKPFQALLGGNRAPNGQFGRLNAHGFFWTATEIDQSTAWSYNFGKGGLALHRQAGIGKEDALSVRCIAK